ncbi:protein cordon-bleu-like isoform X2 [Coregonus clupeaformis]|uniref:protein cordon-bleu-like isoform X2 n=1 Tax=Coregonus clupeaformis TaxID=59861 RepID=UPI001E1C71FD|nr:protein cordon-bleu-like isoform X2 [Coregonus clupeaformis]
MLSRDSPEIQSSPRLWSRLDPWGGSMEEKEENPLEREHTLAVVLPGGLEKTATVHGSKPVMDLLVTLCAQYHLNPSDFTIELQSANRNNISFKPSSLIGAMEAHRILLKPKGGEEKIRRPYVPEATVRLLINYKKNHKAVVRVNPRVPLEQLVPAVCEKCEFDLESTILLRDNSSEEPLDLTRSLNDYGLRELYAKDTAAVSPAVSPEVVITLPLPEEAPVGNTPCKEKNRNEKENRGLFGLFRRIKKKPEKGLSVSAPASRGLKNQQVASVSMNTLVVHSSNTLPMDNAKKRRAPMPPMAGSQSVPANLNVQPLTSRKKRRAPPPPPCAPPLPSSCVNTHNGPPQDPEIKGNGVSLYTLEEEIVECEEDLDSPSSSPNISSPLTQPRVPPTPPSTPSTTSRPSSTFPPSNPYHPSPLCPPSPPSIGEMLTSFRLCQTRAKLKHPSFPTPRPVNSTNGGSPGSLTQSGGSQELRPLSLLQLKTKACGEAWRSPGLREGMTTFTVVPRGQSLRGQRDLEVDLTLLKTQASDPAQTINEHSNGVAEPGLELHQTMKETPVSLEKSEVEGSTPLPDMDSKRSPPGFPEGFTDCVISPPTVSNPSELYQTAPNSPVVDPQESPEIEAQEESASPTDSLDSEVAVQEESESLSEIPNPYAADLLAHTNGIPGDEVTSTPELLESRGSFWKPRPVIDEAEEDRFCFPPPPPPVCYDKEVEVTEPTQLRVRPPGGRTLRPPSFPPPSLPILSRTFCEPAEGDNQTNAPSSPKPNMIHLTSPKPYVPPTAAKTLARKTAIPSCFAQAVALAVRKSQSSCPRRPAPDLLPPRSSLSGSSPSSALPLTNAVSDDFDLH